jgi:hypothetical protein
MFLPGIIGEETGGPVQPILLHTGANQLTRVMGGTVDGETIQSGGPPRW